MTNLKFVKSVFAALLLTLLPTLFSAAVFAQQGSAEAGAEKIATCNACHGETGNASTLPNVPKLGGQGAPYLLKQMQDIKTGVRPVPLMAGLLDPFDEQDLADIAAYFAYQPEPLGAVEEDKLALGEELYRAGEPSIGVAACTACHAPNGKGIDTAGYPSLSGQDPAYTELQLKAFRSGERNNDEAQIMRTITSRLNDAEIAALASYVSGLR